MNHKINSRGLPVSMQPDEASMLRRQMDNWERITYWMAVGISAAFMIAVAAGAMGYVYAKWIA
jgi:hypothetical protein